MKFIALTLIRSSSFVKGKIPRMLFKDRHKSHRSLRTIHNLATCRGTARFTNFYFVVDIALSCRILFLTFNAIMASTSEISEKEVEIVYDNKLDIVYQIGRFLGKGGFARCYEFQNIKTKKFYAGKVICKTFLGQSKLKLVAKEISIHRDLSHMYIVDFHSSFEDDYKIYIILKLCQNGTLKEMILRRETLTEVEVRYFARQIVLACIYLHQKYVIHRDLKLGNLFINDNMEVQVGDFGLAAKLLFEGDRKRAACGTRNYMAPEVVNEWGHSYEADVWSLGCVIYTLLVGAPLPEVSSSEICFKLERSDYNLPTSLSKNAQTLLRNMLQFKPDLRPTMSNLLYEDFFVEGYLPRSLPTSCLTKPPRLSALRNRDISMATTSKKSIRSVYKEQRKGISRRKQLKVTKLATTTFNVEETGSKIYEMDGYVEECSDCHLRNICRLLRRVIRNCPSTSVSLRDETIDPAGIPLTWISNWINNTHTYGFAYQLCNNSYGVLFNDSTRIMLLTDYENFQYIDKNGSKTYYTVSNYPEHLKKKVTLIIYFRSRMINFEKAGGSAIFTGGDDIPQVPHLRAWFRSTRAMIFHLTNGTLQLNFYEDHTKIILFPLLESVAFINRDNEFRLYKFENIERYGCSSTQFSHLKYASCIAERLSDYHLL